LNAGPEGEFFLPVRARNLEELRGALQLSGMHLRWEKAHPNEKDCLDEPMERIKQLIGPSQEIKCSPACALLMFRKDVSGA
jgi:hypothetical protein